MVTGSRLRALLALLALAASPWEPAAAGEESPPAAALDCPPVPGAEPLLERAEVVLVGEIHGTEESPAFVAALACRALAGGRPVTVGFEIAASEEERFAAYLDSDGGEAAREAVLAGPPWQATGRAQYGATSEAMLGLLESLRRLRAEGHAIGFALFNRSGAGGGQNRDRMMAETLGGHARRSAGGLLIALTGNIHSRLTPGTPWDPEYEPMGLVLQRADPELRVIALDVAHAGGTAWMCTPDECGAQRLRARAGSDGEPFAIALNEELQPGGHHGTYYVGEVHASPPAVPAETD